MLPKVNRLKQNKKFKYILQKGKKIRTPYFILCYHQTNEPIPPKIGIIASKKVGKAVERNRAKRIVSEAFRTVVNNIPEGIEIVVVCLKEIQGQTSETLHTLVNKFELQ